MVLTLIVLTININGCDAFSSGDEGANDSGSNNGDAAQGSADGVTLMYKTIYAKGDALLGEYDFYVCDSAESAT